MKKLGRILRSCICALGILMMSSTGLQALVVWSGASTPDVNNDNLQIDGSTSPVILEGLGACNDTSINATSTSITVTITNADAVVRGNANGQTILRLNAAYGFGINFDLTGLYNLTFEGSTDVAFSRLLILKEGDGAVSFTLRGGITLTFTENPGVAGPVEFYNILATNGFQSSVLFTRNDLGNTTYQADQAYTVIGARSVLSYASTLSENNGNATISFEVGNLGDGRMVLQVNDTGAFTMAVHQAVDSDDGICSVNRNVPGYGDVQTVIVNNLGGNADAALVILNYNKTYAEYLIDPYGNQGAAADSPTYAGTFNGLRYGVCIGANHALFIQDNAYLDYVGLANNTCPTPDSLPGIVAPDQNFECPCTNGIQQYLKPRNYSALTVDGWYDPNARPATISMEGGIYFRSGVDSEGNINADFSDNPFTIDPSLMTAGAGEYVFDVEAPLIITGSNFTTSDYNSRIEILSLEVVQHGGPLFPVEGNPLDTRFLARTFATNNNNQLYRYNKAAWLVNDRADLQFVALAHTDENHLVCQNNDVLSEPTYVGGEKWLLSELRGPDYQFNYCINPLCDPVLRPILAFDTSLLQVQTSAAFTGVDLMVPTFVSVNNNSEFRFYSNGYLVDNGTGRSMILGTLIGSQACDGCSIVSDDAHLNIFQDAEPFGEVVQVLNLTASTNNSAVNNEIIDPITDQTSVEVIYLGHNSNISVGTNADTTGFNNNTLNLLLIEGDFFHFGTRGGSLGVPSTSSITGQGGIFVDLNGIFAILPDFIASMNVMVTKSRNGIVDLPPSQVFFSDQVGVTDWRQDLADNPVIVPVDSFYSDYTLNWLTVTKNPNFFPYLISDINVCDCPVFTPTNMIDIPTIQGEVQQLQIVNSRIGDPVHLRIAGGWVREILWINDCIPGEAPTGVIVMQDRGRLGLNNAHRNPDSTFTQTVLGANGITIVANGPCRIDLNTDVIVNNICSIIQGPDFQPGDVIEFLADTPYTFRVTKEGILDLSNFTIPATIRFGGNIHVNFEPGARVILNGLDVEEPVVTVEFSDNAIVEIESSYELQGRILALDNFFGPIDNTVSPLLSVPYTQPQNIYSPLTDYGVGLQNTDPYRVRLMGRGRIRFTDDASLLANTNGILSVETLFELLPNDTLCELPLTEITLELNEAAQFNIGKGNNILGGVLQVGNVILPESQATHRINFTLTINGPDAVFNIGSGGFFGLGAGVVRPNQGVGDDQTNVLADTLFNVNQVTLNLFAGELSHNLIFNSDDERSASFVIGAANGFIVDFDNSSDITSFNTADYLTSGGGNFFLLTPGSLEAGNLGAQRLYNPVAADDNIINAPFNNTTVPLVRMRDGLLASTILMSDVTDINLGPLLTFLALKTGDATNAPGPSRGKADAAPLNPDRFRNELTFGVLGYVDRAQIGRQQFQDVIDAEGGTPGERRSRVYDLGAAAVQVDTSGDAPGDVVRVMQIIT